MSPAGHLTLWALWFYERVVFTAFTERTVSHEQVAPAEGTDMSYPLDVHKGVRN